MIRITESSSNHNHLETLSTSELLHGINSEDAKVAGAVHAIIPAIESFVDACFERMSTGGRLFYLGAGTSGRLGIVDASECPPTFGVDHGVVIGLIAGGDKAIRKAVEFAEDDELQGWKDLEAHQITELDTLVSSRVTIPRSTKGLRAYPIPISGPTRAKTLCASHSSG